MIKDLSFYARKFANLRVATSRARGDAPHKPILLLSVISFLEREKLGSNRIFLSAELISTFRRFWYHIGSNSYNMGIALPFFHLKGDKFWHLQAKPGYESVVSSKVRLGSTRAIREFIQYAYFDTELFELLQDPTSREALINVLVETWFPSKKKEIERLLKIDSFQDFQNLLKEKGGVVYTVEELQDEDQFIVRDAAFRKIVISAYDYRCAFCGLRVISPLSEFIVDGAHIKPFAQFYDDQFNNGVALCKNHHWAFDRGWFGIDENYRIVVSQGLQEDSPHAKAIKEFHGQKIFLPGMEIYFPRVDALQWHFKNVYVS